MSPSRKYQVATGVEAETEPGSRGRVQRNQLGITRKRDMDRAEYQALLHAQEAYLHRVGPRTRFSARLICTMHRDWLGNIYAWAGRYRTVELEKEGFRWPPAYLVKQNMLAFEQVQLRRLTPCRPGQLAAISRQIAEVHGELLLIHPFRDGNGRLARWLADLMALQAQLPAPDYGFLGRGAQRQRERYLNAIGQAYVQDYRFLADFFADAIERQVRRLA
jgi:cell filamentation protein